MATPTSTETKASGAAANTVTLEHINVPPAQTWNYLRVNETSIEVPRVRGGEANLPTRLTNIETAIGNDATAWIDSAIYEPRLISVPANEQLEEPVLVEVESDRGELSSTGVVLHEGSRASVIVIVADTDRTAAGELDERAAESGHDVMVPEVGKSIAENVPEPVSGSQVRISLDRRAHVDVYEYVLTPDTCRHIESLAIELGEEASADVHQYLLGGKFTAAGVACNLKGDRSNFELTTRYFVDGGEKLDMNYLARQRGRSTRVNIDASGVVSEHAEKTLCDTIDLVCGCKGSRGDENETVVLTGEHMVNRSLPTILCDEEDVEGNHGATIGSMSAEQLQYLLDRGLTTEEAEELFADAIMDDAAMHAPIVKVREAVMKRAAQIQGDAKISDLSEVIDEMTGLEA